MNTHAAFVAELEKIAIYKEKNASFQAIGDIGQGLKAHFMRAGGGLRGAAETGLHAVGNVVGDAASGAVNAVKNNPKKSAAGAALLGAGGLAAAGTVAAGGAALGGLGYGLYRGGKALLGRAPTPPVQAPTMGSRMAGFGADAGSMLRYAPHALGGAALLGGGAYLMNKQGSELEQGKGKKKGVMVCLKCKSKIKAESQQCSECGAPIEEGREVIKDEEGDATENLDAHGDMEKESSDFASARKKNKKKTRSTLYNSAVHFKKHKPHWKGTNLRKDISNIKTKHASTRAMNSMVVPSPMNVNMSTRLPKTTTDVGAAKESFKDSANKVKRTALAKPPKMPKQTVNTKVAMQALPPLPANVQLQNKSTSGVPKVPGMPTAPRPPKPIKPKITGLKAAKVSPVKAVVSGM